MEKIPKKLPSQEIPSITQDVYAELAKQTGIDPLRVHFSRQCETASDLLKIALHRKGIESQIVTYWGWEVVNHDFLVFMQNGEEWIADPTWQQFLKQPDPMLPHVLVSRKDELVATLTGLGVPNSLHHIWLQPTS